MSRPEPEHGPDPVAQRLRVRYARRGRLRFASHRDFQRALERALRHAGLPVAFSGGFTRHPKISYAGAAPTGTASEAEYLEVALTDRLDPEAVARALDAALPAGLDIVEIVEAGPGALADRLEASIWRVELPGVRPTVAAEAVRLLLARDALLVTRVTRQGRREVDVRPAIIRLAVTDGEPGRDDPCAILELVVRHSTPAVRPDDVLAGLREVAALGSSVPARVTRLAQGTLDRSGGLADPLGPDRAQSAADGSPQPVPGAAPVVD